MRIQSIHQNLYSNYRQTNPIPQQETCQLKLSPLRVDTVSFGVGEKKLSKTARTISVDLAKKVVSEAEEDAKELRFVLNKYLKPLVAGQKNPNGAICSGERGISVRIKTEDSLRQKVTPRGIKTKWGVKNVGDVIGARLVLRDGSPQAVDKVLFALAEAAKHGAIRITEIEKFNPKQGKIAVKDIEELGYGSAKGRKVLEDASGIISRVGPQPSGYPAIHITIKTRNGYKAEIQIMDVDVEDLKHVEDLGYKIRCGKGVSEKYKKIEKDILPAFEELEEKGLEDAYMDYVSDSYLTAFSAPAQKYNARKKNKFLQIPYYLPQKLDFNYIAQKMQELSAK